MKKQKIIKERTLVIGDIHGGLKSLKQCLSRSQFNYDTDTLICLGDVSDGWPETPQCFEELFKIKNLIYIKGNHDSSWGLQSYLKNKKKKNNWTSQGGQATVNAYAQLPHLKDKHLQFLKSAPYYYIDSQNRIFVHGGFDPIESCAIADLKKNPDFKHSLMWSRDLWMKRCSYENIGEYKEVYVGHTSIWNISQIPILHGNVWFMDTGGGWEGKLSIMDIDTNRGWQSDKLTELYPEYRARGLFSKYLKL